MKILYVTSLSGRRINSFMRSAVVAAKELGYEFTIACNMNAADKRLYAEDCETYGIQMVHVDFERNPLNVSNIKAAKQLLDLMRNQSFDIVHCNTPVGGLIGRICARQVGGMHVIYQAHGFHFWHGAPLKNWLLYYPIEKLLSHWTDTLITINTDDYHLAQKRFQGPKLKYVHGVGVDLTRYDIDSAESLSPNSLREELGLNQGDILLLSVGELNANKNHAVVIRALAKTEKNIHYAIAGTGECRSQLEKLAAELNVSRRVHFLGFRSDMPEIYQASDLFVFPSKREGLPSVMLEAMASSLPCIANRMRGIADLVSEGKGGYLFSANECDSLPHCLNLILQQKDYWTIMGEYNRHKVKEFDFRIVVDELSGIYSECERK